MNEKEREKGTNDALVRYINLMDYDLNFCRFCWLSCLQETYNMPYKEL